MQAHGSLCGFQISEKRKKIGERELEKSWATKEAKVCYQPKNRSSITRRWKNQGRNTQFAKYFACKVEKGRDV